MLDDEIIYRLLKGLSLDPSMSQRTLARNLGMSLGKINYCLKALMEKGWVKIRNFQESDRKQAYIYILTPSGFREKSKVTFRFLRRKMSEFDSISAQISELKQELEIGSDSH